MRVSARFFVPSIIVTSLGNGPNIKVAYESRLSTIACPKRRAIMSLCCRMVAIFAGVGARIAISEGACQASKTREGSGKSCYIYCLSRKGFIFRDSWSF